MMLSDRVAIITGGGRGIGRGIALKFAEEGCSVVIADILADAAEKTVRDVEAKGTRALFVRCDVSQNSDVQAMVKQAIDKFGKIDILVNNAGTGAAPKPIADVSESEWDRTLSINLKGVFLCCKAVIPHMKEKKYGKIINMSSVAAISPVSPVSYTASKGGVLTLTIDLAMELAAQGICVNAILPSLTMTDMASELVPPGRDEKEYYDELAKVLVPMKRFGQPEDIAGAALFLASDLSGYVTGDRIIVGGGSPYRSGL
jgi:NAD(P)-dependent dehydrogenase (short-subunit alcohol dehydrogenase family)